MKKYYKLVALLIVLFTTLTISCNSIQITKYLLQLNLIGTGTGKVISIPSGIDCGNNCNAEFEKNAAVALIASPDKGSLFKTWLGACSGTNATCTVTMTEARTVNAIFNLPAGTLDKSFGKDGIVTTAIRNGSNSMVYAVAIDKDNKIVVAGSSNNGKTNVFALARYNLDGSLDKSFDKDGKLTTLVSATGSAAYAIAIDNNNKIVVAGYSDIGNNSVFALARYNNDGSLDPDFDKDGIVTTAIGNSDDTAYAIAIDKKNRIVVAGSSHNGSNFVFALARYLPNGTLDKSFDTDGKLTTSIGDVSQVNAIAIDNDNKIVAAGASTKGSNVLFALARYNPSGSLDTSFNADGIVTTAIGGSIDNAYAVAIDKDNKIIAAGSSSNGSNDDIALVRYKSDGSLDTDFAAGGKAITSIGGSDDKASSVAIDKNNKIVVAGFTKNGKNSAFALARYKPNGKLDKEFGTDGKVSTVIDGGWNEVRAIAIYDNSKVVVAGYSFSGNHGVFALARYLP